MSLYFIAVSENLCGRGWGTVKEGNRLLAGGYSMTVPTVLAADEVLR